jgi:ABC-type branched-subunit amino acid transport system substrate-binding protein
MGKKGFWHVLIFVFLALVLASGMLLAACGGGGGEKETPTVTATPTATPTETSVSTATPTITTTPTPTPNEGPVKIGGITAWSGPMAMAGVSLADPIIKLVEWQVKQQGGILGGREVQVVRYDSAGTVAGVISGAIKLTKEDNVSVLVFGGVTGADNEAVMTFAKENQILYVSFGKVYENAGNFTVSATTTDFTSTMGSFIKQVLKPETVAILSGDQMDSRDRVNENYKPQLEAAGIKIVYEEYASEASQDFSAYLTKIKYVDPDVLLIDFVPPEPYVTIAKQIMELGGWGDIKVVVLPGADLAKRYPGADGWYQMTLWVPGGTYPGSVKFETEFKAVNGILPSSNHVYWYNCLWTAINAIELAGTDTDRVAIAQAARSGKLQWETPMGLARYNTEGDPQLSYMVTHVENKNLVVVPFSFSQ